MGVLVERSKAKQGSSGRMYSIWKLADLQGRPLCKPFTEEGVLIVTAWIIMHVAYKKDTSDLMTVNST